MAEDPGIAPHEGEGDGEAAADAEIANAAEPKALRQQRRTARWHERQAAAFWNTVFSTEVGRREMWGILASGHAFDERFVSAPNGFPQSEATWCQAGEQRLAFRLYLSWLRLCPEGVTLMLLENEPGLVPPKRRNRAV